MFADTEQPSYSTRALHRPPAKSSFFQLDVQNDWDLLAEAIIGSTSQPNAQLEQLTILLESHGVVVHRVPAPQPDPRSQQPSAIRSPFVPEPPSSPPNKGSDAGLSSADPLLSSSDAVPTRPPLSLFPRNAALVHGTRVIEAPPASSGSQNLQSNGGTQFNETVHADALFNMLESAGAELIRWPAKSEQGAGSGKVDASEEKLVDIDTPKAMDTEEEGPHFSPSDIVILSPTLLITHLSSFTNNKGLEYLWSALSRPSDGTRKPQDVGGPSRPTEPDHPTDQSNPARTTTTLLVRITDPDAPATSPSTPRTTTFSLSQTVPKSNPATYIPLCRALVPIDGRVMLYDPALIAEGEARRLKSVLDRVEEAGGDIGGPLLGKTNKRDSVMSYGTFGSLDRSDDEGWQFISVEGLRATSILLASPNLALLSPVPSTTTGDPTSPVAVSQSKVTEVLESLGVRAVQLPFGELNQLGGGVRDAVLVLRRESNLDASSGGPAIGEREAWDQPGGEEQPQEGCFEAIFAALTAWLCGSLASSGASEAGFSE